jgi:hypothetical protein
MPRGIPIAPLEERFLQRVVIQPCKNPELGNCHLWIGGLYKNGYGEVKKGTYGTHMAHQWACHHWNGSPLPVAKGMCIKHSCDNRECVNPAHLSYGTLRDNVCEMRERNQTAFNKTIPTDEELALLKQMMTDGTPRREMARRLNHARTWVDRVARDYLLNCLQE